MQLYLRPIGRAALYLMFLLEARNLLSKPPCCRDPPPPGAFARDGSSIFIEQPRSHRRHRVGMTALTNCKPGERTATAASIGAFQGMATAVSEQHQLILADDKY